MKTLHFLAFLPAITLALAAGAQQSPGASFQLFTDPLSQASGLPNFGLGAVLGVYDRFHSDYGFHFSGAFSDETLAQGPGGARTRLQNRVIHTGLQFYPFGLRDQIFFERRSHNKRQRFHHRQMVEERIQRCPNACFGRRDLDLDNWLKGFYVGCGYQHGKFTQINHDPGTLKPDILITYRHGVQIDLGYTLSLEFLSLSLNWSPLGMMSLPIEQGEGQLPRISDSPLFEEAVYQPKLSFKIGIALFS